MIYLDYAATTPMSKEALNVFNEAAKKYFGNASSLHDAGTQANAILQKSRQSWADMLGGVKEGVYFTSGGTESNQLALRSLINGNKHRGKHLITTEVEHSSIYNLFKQLEVEGFSVTYLPITEDGQIDLYELIEAIRPETILASIQYINGETGFIQPVEQIGSILNKRKIIFHTDCVQAFGNVEINVKAQYIDALSISSHKLYGPKGTGVVYINPRVKWLSQVKNTTHENGFRPGTVDVPSILSFTAAAQIAYKSLDEKTEVMQRLRNKFITDLYRNVNEVNIYESKENQLPQIIGLSFAKLQGQYIMLECNKYGIAISTGSACQIGQQIPSRTILSLGKSKDEANQFVRISLGNNTTEAELDELVKVLKQVTDVT